MPVEEDFTNALRAALSAVEPDTPSLLHAALRSGRRRRRRQMSATLGGAAAVLAVAVLVGSLAPLHEDARHALGLSRPTPASSDASLAPSTPSAAPTPVGAEALVGALESLLPPNGAVSDTSGTADAHSAGVTLTYRSGQGSSLVQVTLSRLSAAQTAQALRAGCAPVEARPDDVCEAWTLPDGSVLVTTRSFTHPGSDSGRRRWYAVRTAADGRRWTVQELGGVGTGAAAGATDPVLSFPQLMDIVTSPVWDPAMAAVRAEAA